MLLCAVPDVEHMHDVALNREENTVHIVARTVEELPYFLRKMLVYERPVRIQRISRALRTAPCGFALLADTEERCPPPRTCPS